MSEFKFACPVCGQHITADSSTSGGHIECPTCFRKIVVPQAPASTDAKLIISASQADRPRPPQGSHTQSELSARARKAFPFAATLLVLLVLGAALAFAFRDRFFKASTPLTQTTHSSTNDPGAPLKKVYPIPTDLAWTLDLSKQSLPERTAVGSIHGDGFKCERATLQGGNLTLRQGRSGGPDLGVTVHLFAQQGEELSGKSIDVTPDRAPPLPRVVLRWKDDQGKSSNQSLNRGYALKLVFGEALNGRIPGRIYICLPDEAKSFVAGSFTAEIKKPSAPKPKQPKAGKSKSSG
jgi:hypothetical protein